MWDYINRAHASFLILTLTMTITTRSLMTTLYDFVRSFCMCTWLPPCVRLCWRVFNQLSNGSIPLLPMLGPGAHTDAVVQQLYMPPV